MNGPIGMRNIFISSRMQGMAMERDALYHAVRDAGLTPLAYEREARFADGMAVMDSMLDNSDAFLALYSKDIGDRSILRDPAFSPIEYEFWRFIAQQMTCGFGRSRGMHSSTVARQIGTRLQYPAFSDMRDQLRTQCKNRSGDLYSLVNSRVFVYMPADLGPSSVSLDYLTDLPLIRWYAPSRAERRPFLYAHNDLYQKVHTEFRELRRAESVNLLDTGIRIDDREKRLLIRLDLPDFPGLMQAVLYGCFQAGLNLTWLEVHPRDTLEGVNFVLRGYPYYQLLDTEGDVEDLRRLLGGYLVDAVNTTRFNGDRARIRFEDVQVELVDREYRHPQARQDLMGTPRCRVLRIPFVDAPGTLWEIVSRISSTEVEGCPLNIAGLQTDETGELGHVDMEIAISSPPGRAVGEDAFRHGLLFVQHQLRSLMCVLGVSQKKEETHGQEERRRRTNPTSRGDLNDRDGQQAASP